MHRIRIAAALLTALLSALPLLPQQPVVKSKVVQGLTPDQISTITEPRLKAGNELNAELSKYSPPSIARALGDPHNFIGTVIVTEVNPPGRGWDPYLRVDLHLEQLLRGDFKPTELHADTLWMPPRPQDDGGTLVFSGRSTSPFDRVEPKIGNRFLIGFSILYEDNGR